MRDPYDVLGVSPSATDDEIKTAFRELAKRWHPDRNPNNKKEAEEKFKEVSEAYSILSDPERRPTRNVTGSFFDEFLSPFLTTMKSSKKMDLRVGITLSLSQAMQGGKAWVETRSYEICKPCKGTGAHLGNMSVCRGCGGVGEIATFFGRGTCPECGGCGYVAAIRCVECLGEGDVPHMTTIELNIPEGIDDGTALRLSGLGRVARYKGSLTHGDLIVEIKVHKDPNFRRGGDSLYTTVEIPFKVALAGGKVRVKNPLGEEGEVVVPKACKHGHVALVPKLGIKRKPMEVDIIYSLPKLEGDKLKAVLEALGETDEVQKDRD